MESRLLRLTKDVYFNRSGVLLAISVSVAMGLGLLALRTSGAKQQILIAISTSLFASTLFAFLQTMLTSLRYEALMSQSIEDGIESATRRVLEEVALQQREFVPSDVYPAARTPDVRFNRDFMRDMRRTKRFLFRGVTGRYTIARLWSESRVFDEVHLLIANPLNLRGMEPRVTHVISSGEAGIKYEEIERRLVTEIYETVVCARLASAKCRSFTLHFLNEPQVDRVEVLDDALYLTLYSDSTERGTNFPRTVRFKATSSVYAIYMSQLVRSMDAAEQSMVIRASATDQEVLDWLARLGRTASSEDLRSYEAQFTTFARQFSNDSA